MFGCNYRFTMESHICSWCNVDMDPDPGVPHGRDVHVQDTTWGDQGENVEPV